jgi:hypothetical protein
MYSNKYSINLKKSRRRVRPILEQLKHLSTVLYSTAQFYDKVQQIIDGKNRDRIKYKIGQIVIFATEQ